MMTFRRTAFVIPSMLVLLMLTACSNPGDAEKTSPTPAVNADPQPGTPAAAAEGERLLRQMSDTLAGAKHLQFDTKETISIPAADGTLHEAQQTRTTLVQRPNALRFNLKNNAGELTAVYSGTTVSLRNSQGTWASTQSADSLDAMLDDITVRFALPIPVADVIYSVPYDALIGPKTKGGFATRETIEGVACKRLDYEDDLLGIKAWIPESGPALPKQLELTYKMAPGLPKKTIVFSNWNLAPAIDAASFQFTPAETDKQIDFQAFTTAILSSNAGAPAETNAADKP